MRVVDAEHYAIRIELLRQNVPSFRAYPFSLPVVRNLGTLVLHPKVTYIIGENGTGKSTLLEAIAVAWGLNPEGGSRNFGFSTRPSHSDLSDVIRIVKGPSRPRDSFFLRAESFYNLGTEIERLDSEGFGPSVINSYGGISLHEQSHGEAFFATFQERFGGGGLYILDEPEAALSPFRQMAFLSIMHDLIRQKSQFIIATHSPIIMAYPDSAIFVLNEESIDEVSYLETEHYRVARDFLVNPQKSLQELLKD